ncbi:MAG: hypothetical protein OEW92_07000, partial [Gammaproteobacteria bacterium]|nr:hypothetical protein [Gammaproteobacteria bacterium]
PVCGHPLPAGAGGYTAGSQSTESGLRRCEKAVNWQFFRVVLKHFPSMVFFMALRIGRKISH